MLKPIEFSSSATTGEKIKQVISPETSNQVKSILVGVVNKGTCRNAQSTIYSPAGKTSSAYWPGVPRHDNLVGQRGIAGFAPVQNPRLVVYVGVIDQTNSRDRNPHGGEHAAPIFKEVIDLLLQQMKVVPEKSDKSSVAQME